MPSLDPRLQPMKYIESLYAANRPALAFDATTVEEWKKWRRKLKAKVGELLGGLDDPRCDLDVEVLERKQMDGYVREKVIYSSRPEMLVPAYVLVPDGDADGGGAQVPALQRRAAVVCCSGHGYGKDAVVGIDENGKQRQEYGGYERDFAVQMVRQGFVAIAPEHLGFGERRDPPQVKAGRGHSSCQQHSLAALLFGRTNSGMRVYDVMRAIDYLQTRPEVDPKRIGCLGISGGGLVTLFSAAMDDRIQACLVSGYLNLFRDCIIPITHCVDNYIPGLLRYAEMSDVASLIAPRALFAESGRRDPIFPVKAVRESFGRVRKVYELLGVPEKCGLHIFNDEHVFNGTKGIPFMKQWLQGDVPIAVVSRSQQAMRAHRLMMALIGGLAMVTADAGEFQDLGVPVTKAMIMASIIGPDANGQSTRVYLAFNQDGAPAFLVQTDPLTGESRQFNAPSGGGPWALCTGPDGKVYMGSCETQPYGAMYVLDPTRPDEGIKLVGQPSETETYLWQFTVGKDGRIYGCTYPQAKIVSYDPATGELADHGRMDPSEQYSRSIATGADGWIYTGIGMVRANIVAYSPQTGEHHGIIPDEDRPSGCGDVWNAADGNAYGTLGGKHYRLVGGHGVEISESEKLPKFTGALPDGRIIATTSLDRWFTLVDPATGEVTRHEFDYAGAGSQVFVVGEGPRGLIIGGSAVPLQVFCYDPATGRLDNPGNPTATEGEIYSILPWNDYVFLCAYGGAYLSRWNPDAPWDFGTSPENNPYGIGNVGDGHLRPRAMADGPDGTILIGSQPPYGQWGGAMAIFDPVQSKVVENYRHLVQDQGITALAYDAASKLVWGGSSVYGGGGTEPKAESCVIFAWDPTTKQVVVELPPVVGDLQVQAVALAAGKAFFTSVPSQTLTVVDTGTREIVHQSRLEIGYPLEISLELWRDGSIYGLSDRGIFTVDPTSYATALFARPPVGPQSGWAMTDTGIYFGSGVHLWRYIW